MHEAEIWKSIEALCDEAETVSQNGLPIVVALNSTPPPVTSQRFNALRPTTAVTQNETVILTTNPAPPSVALEVLGDVDDRDQTATDTNSPLTPATMADIAAAIEKIRKAPKNKQAVVKDQNTSDDTQQQMMGEISEAFRTILADELPKLVRQAVSAALYDLLTNPKSQILEYGELVADEQKAVIANKHAQKKETEKKSSLKKIISKKPNFLKPPVTKTELKNAAAKKSASPNAIKKRK